MNILYSADRINDFGQASVTSNLVRSLQFPHLSLDIVHVTETNNMIFYGDIGLNSMVIADVERANKEIAEELVAEVAARFPGGATQTIIAGFPSDQILSHASDTKADLIALGGAHNGAIGAFFLGSVARTLTISSPRSLLIGKGKLPCVRPLRAVIATDHSPYMTRAIQKLLQFAPQGIEEITVMTAFNEEELNVISTLAPSLPLDWRETIRKSLREKNDRVCAMLTPSLGAKCQSLFCNATPRDAIKQAMETTKADLLIMGAQGHGFVDRLTLGSTSFHEVMGSPYSVLLLRP